MPELLSLLIALLVVVVLVWAVKELTRAFGVEDPIKTVLYVLVVLIVVVWLLRRFAFV